MHVCKEMCVRTHVTCMFFHVFVVQNYNLHVCIEITRVFCGQHTHGTQVSHLSYSWYVP